MNQDDHHHDHGEEEHCWYKGGPFANELASHLPFSVLSVVVGLILAGVICFLTSYELTTPAAEAVKITAADQAHAEHHHSDFIKLFHLFHPAHMLFSAAATAAMFWRYGRSWLKAVLVGLSGAIVVCGISDIAMPHLSALIMGKSLELHICILQRPLLVLPFATIGVIVGIMAGAGGTIQSTIFSHSMHVLASTMASIFYLIGPFGRLEWIDHIGVIFLFICLAVMIPCCLSDIVYPLLFTPQARKEFSTTGHVHPH